MINYGSVIKNTKQAKNTASHGCFNTQFVNNNFKAIDLKKTADSSTRIRRKFMKFYQID